MATLSNQNPIFSTPKKQNNEDLDVATPSTIDATSPEKRPESNKKVLDNTAPVKNLTYDNQDKVKPDNVQPANQEEVKDAQFDEGEMLRGQLIKLQELEVERSMLLREYYTQELTTDEKEIKLKNIDSLDEIIAKHRDSMYQFYLNNLGSLDPVLTERIRDVLRTPGKTVSSRLRELTELDQRSIYDIYVSRLAREDYYYLEKIRLEEDLVIAKAKASLYRPISYYSESLYQLYLDELDDVHYRIATSWRRPYYSYSSYDDYKYYKYSVERDLRRLDLIESDRLYDLGRRRRLRNELYSSIERERINRLINSYLPYYSLDLEISRALLRYNSPIITTVDEAKVQGLLKKYLPSSEVPERKSVEEIIAKYEAEMPAKPYISTYTAPLVRNVYVPVYYPRSSYYIPIYERPLLRDYYIPRYEYIPSYSYTSVELAKAETSLIASRVRYQ